MTESIQESVAPDATEKKSPQKKSATAKKPAAKKTTAKKTSAKKVTSVTAQKDTVKKETAKSTAKKSSDKKSSDKKSSDKKSSDKKSSDKKSSDKKSSDKKSPARKRSTVEVEVVDVMDTENTVADSTVADDPIIIEEPMTPLIVADASKQSKDRHGGFLNMLYRHPSNRMVAGVCSGIADYIGWDPVLVRVLWVIATVMTNGAGILAYLALALVLPVGTKRNGFVRPGKIEMTEQNLSRASYGMIAFGIAWLLWNFGVLSFLFRGTAAVLGVVFWPALFIMVGLLLLNRNGDKNYQDSFSNGWTNVRDRANSMRNSEGMPQFDNINRGSIRSGIMDLRQGMPIKRSRSNRVAAGVCGGIGQAIGIDANLVRLGVAILSIGTWGMPIVPYAILAILLPSSGSSKQRNASRDEIIIDDKIEEEITIL